MQVPARPLTKANGTGRRTCVCGKSECKSLTDEMERYAADRGGYEEIPKQPNDTGSSAVVTSPHRNRVEARKRKEALRRRWLILSVEGN